MKTSTKWILAVLVVIVGAGTILYMGVIVDAARHTGSVYADCAGECEKKEFEARLEILVCRYSDLPTGLIEVIYVIGGWTGDTDIPAEKTKNGKAFPPDLSKYLKLPNDQKQQLDVDGAEKTCPIWLPDTGGAPNLVDDLGWRRPMAGNK